MLTPTIQELLIIYRRHIEPLKILEKNIITIDFIERAFKLWLQWSGLVVRCEQSFNFYWFYNFLHKINIMWWISLSIYENQEIQRSVDTGWTIKETIWLSPHRVRSWITLQIWLCAELDIVTECRLSLSTSHCTFLKQVPFSRKLTSPGNYKAANNT